MRTTFLAIAFISTLMAHAQVQITQTAGRQQLGDFAPEFAPLPPCDDTPRHAFRAGEVVSEAAFAAWDVAQFFTQEPLDDETFRRMRGRSYPDGCTVPRDDLRYLRIAHRDEAGAIRVGELVVHRDVSADVLAIFREIFEAGCPIGSVRLIDDFDADDEKSMSANNTSAFCFRKVQGSRKLSAHARGRAVDVNPLYNPYVKKSTDGRAATVRPAAGRKYASRQTPHALVLTASSPIVRIFKAHGWKWGGDWRTVKDWQHFELP